MFDNAQVEEWVRSLTDAASGGARSSDLTDAERIDLIRSLTRATCAVAAVQAELTVDLDESQRAEQAARGVPAERRGRGVAAQVALARRESPHRGSQHLGLAKVLRSELPHTQRALAEGRVTEWRATLIARETACLTLADRLTVDERIAGDAEAFEAMGDAEAAGRARSVAHELDPAAFTERRRRAEADRRVSLRPAPDVMSQLSTLLPVKDGVATYACLKATADAAVAAGDGRSRDQIMADTLVDRVTGRVPLSGEATPAPQVRINVVVDDDVLLGAPGAGHVDGYGPIPADLVDDLATGAGADLGAELRRLYATPGTGALVAMDSRARHFPDGLAEFIRFRDRTCRTPWCDAPIRHIDHSQAWTDGGATTERVGRGLCEACNYANQAVGWRAGPEQGRRHTVGTTTPTGHSYRSEAPPTRQRRPTRPRPVVTEIYRTPFTLVYEGAQAS